MASLARRLAVLELIPYHSPNFRLPQRVISNLPSAQLARAYLHESILSKCRRGEALAVVMRSATQWGVKEEPNVVVYQDSEARSAHLSPRSRGGRRLLEWLAVGDAET